MNGKVIYDEAHPTHERYMEQLPEGLADRLDSIDQKLQDIQDSIDAKDKE